MAYKNKEDQKAYGEKYRDDHKEENKKYMEKWREDNPEYDKKRRQNNKEKLRKAGREYHKNNRDKCNKAAKKYKKRVRDTVLKMISGGNPHCVRCGCDDKRLLEINHKDGGGSKENQGGKKAQQFYWDIYMKRRKTDDLELLCRICNARHYLELKYGELPYKIFYNRKENENEESDNC